MDTDQTANAAAVQDTGEHVKWYFMCDQKRRNALHPAYKMLADKGFEVFTPMITKMVVKGGQKKVMKVPLLTDILFIHGTETNINAILAKTPTLHYRFKKGGRYREHIIVADADMERFIYAAEHAEIKEFYALDSLPESLIGHRVTIQGGPLHGYSVLLKKMQGSKKKRIFVELPEIAYAEMELTIFDSLKVEK